MLTDKDMSDIFRFMTEGVADADNGRKTRMDLVSSSSARTIHFLIDHPDMCASEFDDFLLDKEGCLQEFDRLDRLDRLIEP